MTKEWFAYKLYVYDLDDTLYRETDYLFAAYVRIAAACTADKVEQETYINYLCESFAEEGRQGLFQRFQTKYGVKLSLDEMLHILRHTQCPLRLFETREQEIKELLYRGKKVAVVTNGNPEQQRQKVRNLGLKELFPQIEVVYAADIESKPSPRVVNDLLSAYQTDRSDVLLIGDSETDRLTASNAGIDYRSINEK